jgi:SNF2 family DNA or RNA helicase
VPFHLKPKHLAHYKTMQAIEMLPLADGTVTAINAARVSTKLLQIASGAVYENEDTYHVLDTDRYELIMDLLEPRPHSLVFFNWQHQKHELMRAAEARGFSYAALIDGTVPLGQREDVVRNFQAGYYKVLFAHPQSAAHGLTLVKATTTIWASPTYNLEHFMQGNRRIYRAGQTQKTETIVVVAEGTIDEKVYRRAL